MLVRECVSSFVVALAVKSINEFIDLALVVLRALPYLSGNSKHRPIQEGILGSCFLSNCYFTINDRVLGMGGRVESQEVPGRRKGPLSSRHKNTVRKMTP